VPFRPVAALKPKDRVAVVAPSGPFDRATFDLGLERLATRYQPAFADRLFERWRYLAGSDMERARELQAALDDEGFRAIFAARGGYGAMRLLPALELSGRAPRPVIGFSDLTALHARLLQAGWRTLHAPVLTQLANQPDDAVQRLFALLEGRPVGSLDGTDTLVPGVAEGPLLGGNLSVLSRLLGTPYLPSFDGAVLLLEDVGERPYRLDRLWTHFRLAGAFEDLAGIVLGDFTACEEPGAEYTHLDVLRSLAEETGVPCAAGFRVGHGDVNQPVPLGARVRLDASRLSLEFLEPLVTR